MRTHALLVALLALSCNNMGKDAKVPGDPLGTYHVTGSLDTSTCGVGALGSTDVWEFDVKLSKDGTNLYWLNGEEVIPGHVAADGVTFDFDTQITVPIQAAGKGMPGCTIIRHDTASGALSSSDAAVSAFNGRMRFGYTAQQSSDCTALLGVEGGLAALPCEIDYRLDATRTQ